MNENELNEFKTAACVIVGDVLGHFVKQHVSSEREQELLESFATMLQNTFQSMESIDETEEE